MLRYPNPIPRPKLDDISGQIRQTKKVGDKDSICSAARSYFCIPLFIGPHHTRAKKTFALMRRIGRRAQIVVYLEASPGKLVRLPATKKKIICRQVRSKKKTFAVDTITFEALLIPRNECLLFLRGLKLQPGVFRFARPPPSSILGPLNKTEKWALVMGLSLSLSRCPEMLAWIFPTACLFIPPGSRFFLEKEDNCCKEKALPQGFFAEFCS